jgi:hypothetical protein
MNDRSRFAALLLAGVAATACTRAGLAETALVEPTPSESVEIFGISLGGPYDEAVSAARAVLELEADGPAYHRGAGTLDGMGASLEMEGADGRLVDLQLHLRLTEPDQALPGSGPLTRLEADLGAPAEVSADLAVWRPSGFEVTLQRQASFSRGDPNLRVSYVIRGRTR